MSWRTPDGNRILRSREAALFKSALGMLVDMAEEETEDSERVFRVGIPPYDYLCGPVKLAALAEVAEGLLRESKETPPLTAFNEGAVAAIYTLIDDSLQQELADDGAWEGPDPMFKEADYSPGWRYHWRTLIVAASNEREEFEFANDPEGPPKPGDEDYSEPVLPTSDDPDDFDISLQLLEDAVLWDADYLDIGRYLDMAPQDVPTYYSGLMSIGPGDVDLDDVRARLRAVLSDFKIVG